MKVTILLVTVLVVSAQCVVSTSLRNSMPAEPVKKEASFAVAAPSTQCVLCTFVVKELDGLLSQNATEQEIVAALDAVCNLLPDVLQSECMGFVKQYAPALVKILQQEMDPTTVCTFLGLCSSSNNSNNRQEDLPKKQPGSDDSELCGTCETLIQYLDSLLEENSTVQEIENLLDKICNFLPASIVQECDDIVKMYGPAIIQLIAQFADPREVCTGLGFCNNQTMERTVPMKLLGPSKAIMLGTEECMRGPSYWCDSMDNAVQCGAVQHCKRHVWMN